MTIGRTIACAKTFIVFLASSILFSEGGAALAEILPGIGEFNASTDVGDPALKGSAAYDPKTQSYTLTGAGKNMWFDTGFAIHCNNDHVLSFDGKYIYFNSARTGTMQLRRTSIRSTSTFTCE